MRKPIEDINFLTDNLDCIFTKKDGCKVQISITKVLDYLECLEEEVSFLRGLRALYY